MMVNIFSANMVIYFDKSGWNLKDNGLNWAGICGGKRYEYGGKYATGKITKTYRSGEIITIKTLV